jgi:hypothetical protein
MGLRSWFVLTIATACVSCGSGGAQREAACPAPVRTAATRLDVEALLARVTSAQICGLLADRFVGIANGDPPAGAGGGLFPSTGRWWIAVTCTEVFVTTVLPSGEHDIARVEHDSLGAGDAPN